MKISTGLFDHMVLQRNRRDVSDSQVTGTCAAEGPVRAFVRSKGKRVGRFNGSVVGHAAGGKFRARLEGLPAGGPHEIVLRAGRDPVEEVRVRDVLVGDVWILAGQSNMQGGGLLKHAARPHASVRAFYNDDRWRVAADPIHNLWQAVDPVHAALSGNARPVKPRYVGAGPGVAFGREMLRRTGVPQGLISCAHGGTTMAQWDPALKRRGGHSLYGALVRRFRKNGGNVAGVAWYQGESDATPGDAPLYFGRMKAFIRALRRDLCDARLPFVLVQLARQYGRLPEGPESWNRVQEMQRRLQGAVPRCAVVPAVDLGLDDGIHISGAAQARLGKRIGQAMAAIAGVPASGKSPITLKRVRTLDNRLSGGGDVEVEFGNVMGKLHADGRPHGFEIGDRKTRNCIHDIILKGNRALLRTAFGRMEVEDMQLYYGRDFAPYCNITDSAGRSLPVFGPVALGPPAARTPFVQTFRVSAFLPGSGTLHGLERPTCGTVNRFRMRTFPDRFCSLHLEWAGLGDRLVFYVADLQCDEAMDLVGLVGYDGPVKVWVDGKEKLHDPNGTNPAIPDRGRFPFRASRGRHSVVVALGSNDGRAWGIFLRFWRTDVPRKLLKRGPGFYRMPKFVAQRSSAPG